MNSYPLSFRTLVLGGALCLILLTAWEIHWRNQGYNSAPDDNKAVWAEQRGKLEKLGADDIVIIGSSRVLFNIQLDEFEEVSGKRPIMLAAAGATPIPVLTDIVECSDFNGTIIMGVTPPLLFSPFDMNYLPYQRIANWVEYYHNRTYADRLNHQLAKPFQYNLAFLCTSEEGFDTELDLDRRLRQCFKTDAPPRAHGMPDWPDFANINKDRNMTMYPIMSEDPVYVKRVTDFWEAILQGPPGGFPPPEVMEQGRLAVIGYVSGMAEQFKARGGKIIFVRSPSQDKFLAAENGGFPRDKYWDDFLAATDCPGYHFEDYDFMSRYHLPEWSHMATADAREFTLEFTRQLQADGHL